MHANFNLDRRMKMLLLALMFVDNGQAYFAINKLGVFIKLSGCQIALNSHCLKKFGGYVKSFCLSTTRKDTSLHNCSSKYISFGGSLFDFQKQHRILI